MGENWTFDAENLTVGYDGKTVIADVNFSVGAGERILLCGANGLGKSTLLRTLALLQPPVSGKCSFSGSSEKRRSVLIPARIPKVEGFSVEQFVADLNARQFDNYRRSLHRIGESRPAAPGQ